MRLKPAEAVQEVPHWERCAVRIGDLNYELEPVLSSMMAELYESEKKHGPFVALPVYINRSDTGVVRVFPRPDRDYEVVEL